jgi:hypothetical protein
MRLALPLVLACSVGLGAAQDTLEPIRALYASADYEGALSALDRLRAEAGGDTSAEIDRYLVLCLVALGRSGEADRVIEDIIASDPLYHPSAVDAPPRIRAAFAAVRRRVVPTLVRGLYVEGKAAFDRKSFAEATQKLERVLQILDVPETGDQPELADLRTLAAGFFDLSRASIAKTRREEVPPADSGGGESRSTPVIPPPPSDPVVVRQVLPPWTYAFAGALFAAEYRGAIEVDIDERGQVVGAEIAQPIHPLYDPLLLAAARDWKYEPARRNGQPVKIRKRVDVVLRPR